MFKCVYVQLCYAMKGNTAKVTLLYELSTLDTLCKQQYVAAHKRLRSHKQVNYLAGKCILVYFMGPKFRITILPSIVRLHIR